MVQNENTRLRAKQATYLISAHTVLYILYNYAHGKIDLLYVLTDYMPIFLILCLAPLAAVLFLSTPSARQGAVVLLGILPAELIYNIYTRFSAPVPYSVEEPALLWKILYESSFGIVLVLEVIAFWLTFRLLQEIHTQLNSLSENPS
ncbi:MAG: hypothetical protein NTX44_15285 [Ignavibacteriales bacterium]|nr:hypothetical protein [Ignavibacteriales bacterium]